MKHLEKNEGKGTICTTGVGYYKTTVLLT
jgi:hypothetical protein